MAGVAVARARLSSDNEIIVAAGAPGLELLPERAWRDAENVQVVADLNPAPPLGVAGIEASDRARDYQGKIAFGALGIGGLKLRLHRACVGRLFERNDLRLDAAEILALAKEMAG